MSSSHPALSKVDGIATSSADLALLVGRVLLGVMFAASAWAKLTNIAGFVGYLTSLGVPAAGLLGYVQPPLELLLGLMLIFGVATRYAALASFLFVGLVILLAHRYWDYSGPQQIAQYNTFLKCLAIMGGSLALFISGGGRYSVDAKLS